MTEEELVKKAVEYRKELVPYTELGYPDVEIPVYSALQISEAYIAGAKENGIVWHDLRINPDDLPEAGNLVRVRLSSGMERICETEYYEPSEDEIGFGKLIISFYELNELNGEWVDNNEIIAWCELPKFEVEE